MQQKHQLLALHILAPMVHYRSTKEL